MTSSTPYPGYYCFESTPPRDGTTPPLHTNLSSLFDSPGSDMVFSRRAAKEQHERHQQIKERRQRETAERAKWQNILLQHHQKYPSPPSGGSSRGNAPSVQYSPSGRTELLLMQSPPTKKLEMERHQSSSNGSRDTPKEEEGHQGARCPRTPDGVMHYTVDETSALLARSSSEGDSNYSKRIFFSDTPLVEVLRKYEQQQQKQQRGRERKDQQSSDGPYTTRALHEPHVKEGKRSEQKKKDPSMRPISSTCSSSSSSSLSSSSSSSSLSSSDRVTTEFNKHPKPISAAERDPHPQPQGLTPHPNTSGPTPSPLAIPSVSYYAFPPKTSEACLLEEEECFVHLSDNEVNNDDDEGEQGKKAVAEQNKHPSPPAKAAVDSIPSRKRGEHESEEVVRRPHVREDGKMIQPVPNANNREMKKKVEESDDGEDEPIEEKGEEEEEVPGKRKEVARRPPTSVPAFAVTHPRPESMRRDSDGGACSMQRPSSSHSNPSGIKWLQYVLNRVAGKMGGGGNNDMVVGPSVSFSPEGDVISQKHDEQRHVVAAQLADQARQALEQWTRLHNATSMETVNEEGRMVEHELSMRRASRAAPSSSREAERQADLKVSTALVSMMNALLQNASGDNESFMNDVSSPPDHLYNRHSSTSHAPSGSSSSSSSSTGVPTNQKPPREQGTWEGDAAVVRREAVDRETYYNKWRETLMLLEVARQEITTLRETFDESAQKMSMLQGANALLRDERDAEHRLLEECHRQRRQLQAELECLRKEAMAMKDNKPQNSPAVNAGEVAPRVANDGLVINGKTSNNPSHQPGGPGVPTAAGTWDVSRSPPSRSPVPVGPPREGTWRVAEQPSYSPQDPPASIATALSPAALSETRPQHPEENRLKQLEVDVLAVEGENASLRRTIKQLRGNLVQHRTALDIALKSSDVDEEMRRQIEEILDGPEY